MNSIPPVPKGLPREQLAFFNAIGPHRRHAQLEAVDGADSSSADTLRDKHVSNADLKSIVDHGSATSAHGADGNVVGANDLPVAATPTTGGLVRQAVNPGPDIAEFANPVTSADATDLATVLTLANETKADHNNLMNELQILRLRVNQLMQNLRDAGLIVP